MRARCPVASVELGEAARRVSSGRIRAFQAQRACTRYRVVSHRCSNSKRLLSGTYSISAHPVLAPSMYRLCSLWPLVGDSAYHFSIRDRIVRG